MTPCEKIALVAALGALAALGLFIWILIESKVEAGRLRRMREETDIKRGTPMAGFNYKEKPKRARFLP